MALYFSNSLSSSIWKNINLLFLCLSSSLTLKDLTYPLILDNIESNGLITSSKYPVRYLGLVFCSNNFEATVLSTLTSQVFIDFFAL